MGLRRFASTLLLGLFGLHAAHATAPALQVPQEDRRGEDQTYLTFPEWYLVFSPDEYAASLEASQPGSAFPFFGHVGQFWHAYAQVIERTRRYPFNGEYHTMIGVIGVSTTVEYGVKGAYETMVGRLAELTSEPNATAEDRLATKRARDYVEFIRVRPWYEFDFAASLRELWFDTPWWGPHALRKWERRYALTSEWLVKAAYGAALERATHSTFEIPKTTTAAVITGLGGASRDGLPDLRELERAGEAALITVPRYQGFTDYATALARQGVEFVDIAGNRGPILVSLVAPQASAPPAGTALLIRQPIVTRPGFERRVLEVPVAGLSRLLRDGAGRDGRIEHVFDF